MSAVSNCSPLRYFIAIGRTDLLPAVLGNIAIPEAVFRELTHLSAPQSVRSWMMHPPNWLTVQSIVHAEAKNLNVTLDAGETEAIQLALLIGPDFLLMDERLGRREAEAQGLRTIGALGILLESHRLGLLAEPAKVLGELRIEGFRVSRRLHDEFLRILSKT